MKRRYRPCPIFDWQSPSRWLRPTLVRECRFLKDETLEQFALYAMPRYCWTLLSYEYHDIRYWMVTLAQPDIRTLTIARQPGPRREYQRTWCLSSSPHLHGTPCKVSKSFQYSCYPIQMCACEPVSVGGTLSNWSKSPKTSIWGPSAGTLGKADGQPLASRGPRWNSPTAAILTQHWLFHNEHLTLNWS